MRLILIASLLAAAPAAASSPAAWRLGNAAARTACLRAAGLREARATEPVLFSDRSGQSAVLVAGRYRQRALKGRAAQMLCLYDRRTRRAEVSEARGWVAH